MMRDLAPPDPEVLTAELGRVLTIIGGPMAVAERKAWIAAVSEELVDIQGDITVEALKFAKRECTRPSEVLAFVYRYAKDYPQRARARLQGMIALADHYGIAV